MIVALRVTELICSLVFVCAFFMLLGLVANAITGLDLDAHASIAGGTLWGTHLFARAGCAEQERKKENKVK